MYYCTWYTITAELTYFTGYRAYLTIVRVVPSGLPSRKHCARFGDD